MAKMTTISGDDDSYDEINKRWGSKCWRNVDGQYHRDGDYPAVIRANGSMYYFKNEKLHRDGDLPAVIHANGSAEYYRDGKPHRDGGLPTVIWLMN